jgi:hypothetical protein
VSSTEFLSHPFSILICMWFKRSDDVLHLPDTADLTFRCTGTLVLHADGTDECEHVHECGADELAHDLVVACHEIGCSCVGDELLVAA